MGDKAFGSFGDVGSVFGDSLSRGLNSATQGLVTSGIDKLNSKIGKALGPFGTAFGTGGASGGWLQKANKRADPHLQIDWTIEMPDGFDSSMIEEVQAPMADFQVSAGVFRGGQRMYYADVQDISALSLVFYEDNKFTSSQYLQGWYNKIGVNGTINYPSKYKRTITVRATDVKQKVIAQFTYYGCWPSKLPTNAFHSKGSERTTLSVDFATDGVLVTFPGASGGGLGSLSSLGFGGITDFVKGLPTKILGSVAGGVADAAQNAVGKIGKLF